MFSDLECVLLIMWFWRVRIYGWKVYYYNIKAVLSLLMVHSVIFSVCASQWDAQTEPKVTVYFNILASLLSSNCPLFDCS